MQSHLSYSDLFHLSCCASALWFLLCVSRRGTQALAKWDLFHGKNNLLVVGFPSLCEPHSCGPQENRTGCGETHSAWRSCSLQKTRLQMSYRFSHAGVSSAFLEVKASSYEAKSYVYSTEKRYTVVSFVTRAIHFWQKVLRVKQLLRFIASYIITTMLWKERCVCQFGVSMAGRMNEC